jgi:acyl-[acyl-carrier-protein] desaturase
MLANWGYEECKHSMVLEDWLLHARMRSDEQMTDMHSEVFAHEWDLPHDNARGMVCYTLFQELATQVHYANLRQIVRREGGCPALEKLLLLVSVDEAAHADFFRRLVAIYLEDDRPGTLEQIRLVTNSFRMPAVHMLADSRKRMQEVLDLHIFDESMFISHVYEPILARLNISRTELRRRTPRERVVPLAGANVKP